MKRIVLFTQETCPKCPQAKELLKEKGVSYEEYNLDDLDGLTEWAEIGQGIKGTPLLVVGEKAFLGPEEIKKALDEGKHLEEGEEPCGL